MIEILETSGGRACIARNIRKKYKRLKELVDGNAQTN
jgi:hypothetical protein